MEAGGFLAPAIVQAMRKLDEFEQKQYEGGSPPKTFLWPLFRSQTGFSADDPCWSARVRRDLDTLGPELRAMWLPIFDAGPDVRGGAFEPSKSCLRAIGRLGQERLVAGLQRSVELLSDGTPLRLSPDGTSILRHVLLLIDKVEGSSSEALLHGIACAPWRREEETAWLRKRLTNPG